MKMLTKKHIFARRIDGKPIIMKVEEGHGRWATKEDAKLLYECGIIVSHDSDLDITTHDILTYLVPFDIEAGPITRLPEGQLMPKRNVLNVTD